MKICLYALQWFLIGSANYTSYSCSNSFKLRMFLEDLKRIVVDGISLPAVQRTNVRFTTPDALSIQKWHGDVERQMCREFVVYGGDKH
jgi:hypothetical protein